MKRNLWQSCAWLGLVTLALAASALRAQDGPPPEGGPGGPGGPGGGPGWHHHFDFLTEAEKQELKTAREAVFAAQPDLKKEQEDLHQEGKALHENKDATPEQKKDFFEKAQDFQDTVREAMIKQDPNLQAVFDKIKQHMQDWRDKHAHPDDAPPADQ